MPFCDGGIKIEAEAPVARRFFEVQIIFLCFGKFHLLVLFARAGLIYSGSLLPNRNGLGQTQDWSTATRDEHRKYGLIQAALWANGHPEHLISVICCR